MKKSDVIKYFGSKAAVARHLNIKWSAVHQWRDQIPMRRAYELERSTRGALTLNACSETLCDKKTA